MKTCDEIDSLMTPYVDGESHLAAPGLAGSASATVHGVDVVVPVGDSQEQVELVDARSCEYDCGRMAHLLYEVEGRQVSLFVVPDGSHAERSIEVVGHQARLWSAADVGYVLVGAGDTAVMDKVAAYMRAYGR